MQTTYDQTRAPSTALMDPESSKELPGPLKKFYKGEPLALGITQLFIGITEIVFGSMLHLSYADIFHFLYFVFMTPYWTGMPFLISGLLSVAAARKPNPSLVKSILGMNVVSALAASLGMILLSLSLAHVRPYYSQIDRIPVNIVCGIMGIFLVFNILEFCISLSSAVFGCKTLCRGTFTEKVVAYQSAPPVNPAHLPMAHHMVHQQWISPENALSLPAASKDAENPLSSSSFSPPTLPPLAPASEAQGLDESIHPPIPQASSGDVEVKEDIPVTS